jgi:hypothetical protein
MEGEVKMKQRLRQLLNAVNLVPSRQKPFLYRRYPYRGRRRMLRALGPELAAMTVWPAADTPLHGDLAAVFNRTPGVHKLAHYLPVYEAVLDRSRPIRRLEIGVFHGGSLQMWRDYVHPQSVIVGIDIDPECKRFENAEQDVHVRIGGQQDISFLREVTAEFGPFDVVLDDGSHMTSHMVDAFRYLFANALTDRGIYIVEDVVCNYWTPYRDSRMSFVDFTKILVDAMHAHYQIAGSETNFRIGHRDRLPEVPVPVITPMLGSIEIRDSIVVVRRGSRELPRSIYRC